MTEKPILFSGPMVKAILDGTKTQTRRVVKPQPDIDLGGDSWVWRPNKNLQVAWPTDALLRKAKDYPKHTDACCGSAAMDEYCPYGQPGDRLIPAITIPSLGRRYAADTYGRVWSRAKGKWRVLKGSPTSKGYFSVTPAKDGGYATRLVHRLVAEAYYGAAPKGLRQARHLNGDRTDNAPENLDWGSQEDNWTDRIAHGRGMGEDHHAAKLMMEDARTIRTLCAAGRSQRGMARRFGVAQSAIWAVLKGNTWAEHPKPNPPNCARWASRIDLEVLSMRAERVQEISTADIDAEGLPIGRGLGGSQEMEFRQLWDSINATRGFGWDVNPYVWIVEFKRIKP